MVLTNCNLFRLPYGLIHGSFHIRSESSMKQRDFAISHPLTNSPSLLTMTRMRTVSDPPAHPDPPLYLHKSKGGEEVEKV